MNLLSFSYCFFKVRLFFEQVGIKSKTAELQSKLTNVILVDLNKNQVCNFWNNQSKISCLKCNSVVIQDMIMPIELWCWSTTKHVYYQREYGKTLKIFGQEDIYHEQICRKFKLFGDLKSSFTEFIYWGKNKIDSSRGVESEKRWNLETWLVSVYEQFGDSKYDSLPRL